MVRQQPRSRLDPHGVETLLEISERKIVPCTAEDLLAYLELNPISALAMIYDDKFEFPENVDSRVVKIVDRVTGFLASGTIPHPSQTLSELSDYIQENVINKLNDHNF